MNNNNYAVIMAGGVGSRFWPMSKSHFPKQFIDVLGTGETLIQQTFKRFKKICPVQNIFIITNIKYKEICLSQLSEISSFNILCEPLMRNTAPCIGYAVFKIQKINNNANIIVAPSDHIITNLEEFERVTNNCLELTVKHDILLTLGINPLRPETGYGYIQFIDKLVPNLEDSEVRKVKTFTEKPNQDLALNFLDSGDFLWNSGVFVFNVKAITLSFRKYLRDMYDVFEEGKIFYNTKDEQKYIDRIFSGCKNISIDYAIMERAENVYVYPSDFGWSDLGTWSALYEHVVLDQNQNAILAGEVKLYESHNNIINIPAKKTVVIHGLDGYIIVEKDDSLLICKKQDEQEIKNFVADLRKGGKSNLI